MIEPPRHPSAPLSTGPLTGTAAVAVSPHYLASQAALDAIEGGGNAADAAVVADAVLAVVAPDTCGPGGDLFAIVHRPGDGRPAVLNASGRAGSGVSAAALRDVGLQRVPAHSPSSITVPGCVDGWEALSERFSRRGLRENLATAIELANSGFEASRELAASLNRIRALIVDEPSAAPLYPDGAPPEEGATLRRPALSETLRTVATDGRAAFYRGPAGEGITRATEGAITAADLGRNQAEWVEPTSLDLFGLTAWTVPPNSQGWITLATLRIFELLDPPRDPENPAFHHALIEAYRSVVWERADTTTDPETAPAPPAQLLDADRLARRARRINHVRARTWNRTERAPGGTAYLATRDHDGMVVSFIQSNFWGIGSGRSAGATGVWLHNRGAGFDLRPGHPNELAPGRRPLHTLAPTLWTAGGRARLVLGTRGGDQQPQYLAQVAADQLWARSSPGEAQQAPRWSIEIESSTESTIVRHESRYPASTIAGLAQRGHAMSAASAWEPGWGPVSIITIGDDVEGSADPRVSTTAALASG